MLLLLFVGAKASKPPPVIDTTLQTVLTRWDIERFTKRRPVFKSLLEEAEYDLKLAYNKLQSVAFNKRPAARREYEELKEIVEELRNDDVLRQRIKRAEKEVEKTKLKAVKRQKELQEKYGPGLLNIEFIGPRIFKK